MSQRDIRGATASNGQAQSPIFKMNADCWDEVFDCLSLEDVHSFGQTCKAFQRVAGEYFKWKYEGVSAECGVYGIYINHKQMNGFSAFFHMEFKSVNFFEFNFDLIKCVFTKLEVLELRNCKFNKRRFGALIKSCLNLKRLHLKCVGLPIFKHPTLEHLGLYHSLGRLKKDKLKTFLEQSPKLRSLEIDTKYLYENRESILNANVQLNDLTMHFNNRFKFGAPAFVDLLNELHQRGFYKRLHFFSPVMLSPDQLLALSELVTLYDDQGAIYYPLLNNVKKLVIYGGRNMCIDPTVFINVEYISIYRTNLENIRLLVRDLVKLKAIYIIEFFGNVLDICPLNKERKKLEGSQKVTIYVDEKASKQTTFDLIEIRRKTSNNIIFPSNFWWRNYSI